MAQWGYLHLTKAFLRCCSSLWRSSGAVQTVSTVGRCTSDTVLGRWTLMAVPLQVLVSMCGLAVHCNRKGIVCLQCYQGIKEWDGPISLSTFYYKLDCWIYTVDVIQKCLFVSLLLDDPCAIHKPKPNWAGIGGRTLGFSLKMFHVQIGNYWAYWSSHSCSLNLFTEFILKGKVRQNPRSSVMFCTGNTVLSFNFSSFSNRSVIFRARSIGTEVKIEVTS